MNIFEERRKARRIRRAARRRLTRLRQHEAELRDKIDAQEAEAQEHRTKARQFREAGDDARADYHAELVDEALSRAKVLRDLLERNEAAQLKPRATARRAGKRLKWLAQQAARGRYYASRHFRYDEFDCNDGTPMPRGNREALRVHCRETLEPLRSKYGSCHVNSGYRHRAYNASIGGASLSYHIFDEHPKVVATDVTFAGAGPSTIQNEGDRMGVDGMGYYSSFTHLDNRCREGSPRSRWYGP